MLNRLEPKLTRSRDRELLEAARAFTADPDKLASDSKILKMAGVATGTRRARP